MANNIEDRDDLDKIIFAMFRSWRDDIDSVDVPVLVTDEKAIQIVHAAMQRPHVVRRIINWVMNR